MESIAEKGKRIDDEIEMPKPTGKTQTRYVIRRPYAMAVRLVAKRYLDSLMLAYMDENSLGCPDGDKALALWNAQAPASILYVKADAMTFQKKIPANATMTKGEIDHLLRIVAEDKKKPWVDPDELYLAKEGLTTAKAVELPFPLAFDLTEEDGWIDG